MQQINNNRKKSKGLTMQQTNNNRSHAKDQTHDKLATSTTQQTYSTNNNKAKQQHLQHKGAK
jgi:hypothetical protein